MAFTYNYGRNPPIDYPRLLIPDSVEFGGPDGTKRVYVFEDEEILSFYAINQAQVWQSGMFYSGVAGRTPQGPLNYYRAAATALNAIAGNQARLLAIAQLLDVKLNDPQKVVAGLQAVAKQYLDMDNNSGAFILAEQCTTTWGFIQRFWNQVQRQSGGYIG
jgi:hypothetical protein